MKDTALKFVSLLIAMSLAVYVTSESNSSVLSVMIPIEIRNLPQDRVILISSAAQAKVTLYGPSFMLSRFNSSAPIFRVDFPSQAENRFKVQLQADQLGLPSAVDIRELEPAEVEFTIDKKITRLLPIEVQKIGDLPKGFTLAGVQIVPERVEVVGAETDLKNVNYLETIPLDLREIKSSRDFELEVIDPGRFSSCKTKHVKVHVEVQVESKERKFENVQIEIRSKNGLSYSLHPKSVTIELSGPIDVISALKESKLDPYVRLEPETTLPVELPVQLELGPQIELILLKPEKVTVSRNSAKIKNSSGKKP